MTEAVWMETGGYVLTCYTYPLRKCCRSDRKIAIGEIGHFDRRLAAALSRPCASRHKVFLTKTAPTRAPNRIGLEISGHSPLNNLLSIGGGMLSAL